MLRIVTDGGADMPAGWESDYQIDMIPLRVRFGEETYVQGVDIGPHNFYRLVEQKRIIPHTSLPSPSQIVEFYRSVARQGDTVLSIHLASKMSGTFAAVQLAAKELMGEIKVIPFDSGAGSAVLGLMCREARIMERAGRAIQDIEHHLDCMRKKITVIFTLDTLEFAHMSGRINAFQSALSSILKIKPIIILKDGLLLMAEKVRTRQKALERVIEYVKERVGNQEIILAVVHAADPETAHWLIDQSKGKLNIHELVVSELSIPVAANLGPRTIGIVAIPTGEDC